MIGAVIALAVLGFILYQLYFYSKRSKKKRLSDTPFPETWRAVLNKRVHFYQSLDDDQKADFERRILLFLEEITFTWVGIEENDVDIALVGASAIIPVFYLGESKYPNLKEVVMYPDHFDADHNFKDGSRPILGMVGNGGYANRTMFLSSKSLRNGFRAHNDRRNTAIHEFVHLIDGWDGEMDGIPEYLLEQPAITPWINLIHRKTQEIIEKDSDIRDYATTGPHEFITVVGEYFFERPNRMKSKHPELYAALQKMFRTPK